MLAACVALFARPVAASDDARARDALRAPLAELEAGHSVVLGSLRVQPDDVWLGLYRRSAGEPLWRGDVQPVLDAIDAAAAQGLDARPYALGELQGLRDQAGRSVEAAAALDLLASKVLVRIAYDVRYGRVPARAFDRTRLSAHPLETGNPAEDLARAVSSGRVADLLQRLEPASPFYRRLKDVLREQQRALAKGGWPTLGPGPSVRPGARDPRVRALRERLFASGELPRTAPDAPPDELDPATAAALRAFQESHGLEADGVLGASTLAALNVSAAARLDQVRATLERCRWFLRDLPRRFVVVNVPAYRALFVEDGFVKWRSRVIVGQPWTRTPMFRAEMTHVILNPTWTVPRSILRNEFFPAMQKDPDFLAKKHIAKVGNEYVQRPGPDNALGRIKLVFPNPYSVYLHDTPTRSLFDRSRRTFSHGCVRLQDPVGLAALALDDPAWTVQSLEAAIATGATRQVNLAHRLAVFVMYWSVTATADGKVEFLPDVYGRDAALLAELDRAAP